MAGRLRPVTWSSPRSAEQEVEPLKTRAHAALARWQHSTATIRGKFPTSSRREGRSPRTSRHSMRHRVEGRGRGRERSLPSGLRRGASRRLPIGTPPHPPRLFGVSIDPRLAAKSRIPGGIPMTVNMSIPPSRTGRTRYRSENSTRASYEPRVTDTNSGFRPPHASGSGCRAQQERLRQRPGSLCLHLSTAEVSL